ncbi:DUF916 domain-containing protein [Patescibacteria group bacterium]|nr:DUF916 domain-containing protein [Patescibacteria group bacterium]
MQFSLPFMARLVGVLACVLLGLSASTVRAQANLGAGIGISPAIIEEGATPGEVKRYTVSVANLSDTEQKYYLYVRDIVGVKNDNSPVYAEEGVEPTGFELSSWVQLDAEELVVAPGTEAPLSFTLTVPDTASPGSHFGAVFVSVEPPRLRTTGAAVGYEVANIVSIRVAGDANEKAEIRQFSTGQYFYGSTNVDFSLRIENLGNVLVRPTGPLEITNMFGENVATLVFNDSQASVFPGVVREYSFKWSDDGIGFGRYLARVSPIYGEAGSKSTISSTVSFWVLPMNIIGPAAITLALILLAIYVGVKLYVRRTMAIMSGAGERRMVRTVRRRGSPVLLMTFIAMLATTVLFLILLLLIFA